MDWLLANWFWVLVFAVFIGIHLFGHGGHGGHGGGGHGGHDHSKKDHPEEGEHHHNDDKEHKHHH